MSRFLYRNLELLEPYEGKLSCTVLRGESSRKGADLPDHKKNKQEEFRSNVEVNIDSLEPSSMDKEFLDKVISVIKSNMSEGDFDVVQLADALAVSKSSLYRKMKIATGLSPIEFIRNIRLKHGSQLLKDKSISVAEVAYECGFSNPKYFATCFKEEFGVTPKEYQKSC